MAKNTNKGKTNSTQQTEDCTLLICHSVRYQGKPHYGSHMS